MLCDDAVFGEQPDTRLIDSCSKLLSAASTFQTILVTKKHPRQRQAGSRRNFLGLLTNYIVTAAAGKVSRKMALGSADLSPLILPDSPVESLLDQHQLKCVDSGAS